MKITLNDPKHNNNNVCSCGIFSLGTQERVRKSHGKRAIGVQTIEVLLYYLHLWPAFAMPRTALLDKHYLGSHPQQMLDNLSQEKNRATEEFFFECCVVWNYSSTSLTLTIKINDLHDLEGCEEYSTDWLTLVLFTYTGRRPVMAVFYYSFISCNRNIVSSDSTSLIK